ncbi:MAG: c-type cytochrome [Pseudomonadota bacterium]
MRPILLAVLGGGLLAQGIAAAEPEIQDGLIGDPDAGRAKAGQCRTCHGLDGFARIPIAPHIGGEPEGYLRGQLTAFRDGVRVHEMMSVVAKGLSDQDIADLGAWYGAHTATASLPAALDDDAAPAACAACHGADGLGLTGDAPNLAGETSMYIDTQLKAFRSGKREHEIMSSIAADLSNDEIRALAQWYADIELTIAPPGG